MELTGTPALIAIFVLLAIPIWLITLVISIIRHRLRRRHLISRQVIIAEYQPPAHLTPAEIGYLFDSRIGRTELIATLVDLQQRGFVVLTKTAKGEMEVNKTDRETNDLVFHERYLLDAISGNNNVTFFTVKALWGFKQAVIETLSARGYVKTRSAHINYYIRRTGVSYITIGVLFIALISHGSMSQKVMGVMVGIFLLVFGFPFFIALAMGSSFIYNKVVGQPGLWTDALKRIWPDLEGYREYIRMVELGRLRFESQELKTISENHALPYAIALDFNTEWNK